MVGEGLSTDFGSGQSCTMICGSMGIERPYEKAGVIFGNHTYERCNKKVYAKCGKHSEPDPGPDKEQNDQWTNVQAIGEWQQILKKAPIKPTWRFRATCRGPASSGDYRPTEEADNEVSDYLIAREWLNQFDRYAGSRCKFFDGRHVLSQSPLGCRSDILIGISISHCLKSANNLIFTYPQLA